MDKAKKIVKNIFFLFLGLITAAIFAFFFLSIFVNSSSVVEIPYLVGEDKNVALASLKELNLIPNLIGNGDKVLYTDPSAGTKVKEGHHVIVQLRNLEPMKVPDLIGLPLQVGEQFLLEYKIVYEIRYVITYSPQENDVVLDMFPKPGKTYSEEKLILYVGKYGGNNWWTGEKE